MQLAAAAVADAVVAAGVGLHVVGLEVQPAAAEELAQEPVDHTLLGNKAELAGSTGVCSFFLHQIWGGLALRYTKRLAACAHICRRGSKIVLTNHELAMVQPCKLDMVVIKWRGNYRSVTHEIRMRYENMGTNARVLQLGKREPKAMKGNEEREGGTTDIFLSSMHIAASAFGDVHQVFVYFPAAQI